MADNNNKTVEEQIRESDLVNRLKAELGEKGEDMAKAFLNIDKDNRELALFVMGCKGFLNFDLLQAKVVSVAILKIKKEMPTEADILVRCFNMSFMKMSEEYAKKMKK